MPGVWNRVRDHGAFLVVSLANLVTFFGLNRHCPRANVPMPWLGGRDGHGLSDAGGGGLGKYLDALA